MSESLEVCVDFLVPEGLADPKGRRAARLGDHGDRTARKAKGLEAVAVEWDLMTISALDPNDHRHHEVRVAGPTALLIAKLHKLAVDAGEKAPDFAAGLRVSCRRKPRP
jgi:hypothetical protein